MGEHREAEMAILCRQVVSFGAILSSQISEFYLTAHMEVELILT